MTQSLWIAKDIAAATEAEWLGAQAAMFNRIIIDSRQASEGDVFVALIGENHDAHAFVKAALEQGASAALVSYIPEDMDATDERLFLIDYDPLEGLVRLGNHARERLLGKVVAVTGSVGKTSTKEALKVACESLGRTYVTGGNYNNHIGVPLTLANMPFDTEYAIIEMGMSAAGEIAYLTNMARPHVAIITAIEAAHMEFFESVEGIADAKLEIAEGLIDGGTLVLPHDNAHYDYLRVHSSHIDHRKSFGAHDKADFKVLSYELSVKGAAISANIDGIALDYTIAALGEHWAGISAVALGAVSLLGGYVKTAAEALAKFSEPKGRGRLTYTTIDGGEVLIIDDSYNASPASMRAAFAKLKALQEAGVTKGRLVAVLGDMLEMGDDATQMHSDLAASLQDAGIDVVYAAGEMMKHMFDALPDSMQGAWAEDAASLNLQDAFKPDDAIMFKGSNGSKIYTLVAALS